MSTTKPTIPQGPVHAVEGVSQLGKKVTEFQGFETFARPVGVSRVTCISDEVTANCPVTNQPDWYVVKIEYVPVKLCVESKTLKLYLHSYRNAGLFCEAFAAKIARDIGNALAADSVNVTVTQKPRGGVAIIAEGYWNQALEDGLRYQAEHEADKAS